MIDSATAWLKALEDAGPIPSERPDVIAGRSALVEAIAKQRLAYEAIAACGSDAECQLHAMEQTSVSAVVDAVNALPAN
jgi:hypothetical protein